MYSLGFLIVELETATRRLLYVLGCQIVHQQVDLALSQFPKGLAELASDQAPPTRLAFGVRINHAPRIGQSCEVGITSIH
jgi:hypothetical protein